MPLFEVKTKLYFGQGEKDKLLEYLGEHGFKRCGVVIDGALLFYDLFKSLLAELRQGLEYLKILEYKYKGEPTYGYLNSVKDFFKEDEVDCLIGLGGGSVLDVAKGLAVLINNPVSDSLDLRGFPKISNLPVPVVAIPTISGTGSEVTYNAVFMDDIGKVKLGINTKYNFPVFALTDPQLALSAPLKQSLSSALDCLVHSLESFMSKKANSISRPLSIEAFNYAFFGIKRLLEDPKDIKAREQLMYASYVAGIALMNSSAGPAGALSYPLGVYRKVPHGLGGAFFVQHVLDYNLARGYTDFYLLYDRVNKGNSFSKEEKAAKFVCDVKDIIKKSNVPVALSEFGAKKEDIPNFVSQGTKFLWGAFEMNPVVMSKEELKELLTGIL